MRVLIVEDDPALAKSLAEGLGRHGYEPTRVDHGAAALAVAADHDVVLLDLGLPDIDGQEVCRRLRTQSNVPIIVTTARGDEVDRVVLLELGADDYLVKPFGFRELVARIGAVTRRSGMSIPEREEEHTQVGALRVDRSAHRVWMGEDEVALTRKEFDLLALLAETPGAVRTREEIIDAVWDANWYGPTKTLDVHISALRRKLGAPELITTVRGVGYRLESAE